MYHKINPGIIISIESKIFKGILIIYKFNVTCMGTIRRSIRYNIIIPIKYNISIWRARSLILGKKNTNDPITRKHGMEKITR